MRRWRSRLFDLFVSVFAQVSGQRARDKAGEHDNDGAGEADARDELIVALNSMMNKAVASL